MSSEDASNNVRRRVFFVILSIGAVGAFVTSALFLQVRSIEQAALHAEFEAEVSLQAADVRDKLNQNLLTVHALATFVASIDHVTPETFTIFTRSSLDKHPEIRSLQWVPAIPHADRRRIETQLRASNPQFGFFERTKSGERVPAGTRKTYFPILYAEPQDEGTRAALGFDMGASPVRLATLNASIDTGAIAVSPRITLAGTNARFGLVAAAPVFQPNLPSSSPAERRAALKGFATAVYDISLLMPKVMPPVTDDPIKAKVSDAAEPGVLLYHSGTGNGELGWRRHFLPEQLTSTQALAFGGRRWEIEFTASSRYLLKRASLTHLLIPPLGGLLTFLLVAYAVTVFRQRERLEDLVQQRTETLRESEERFRDLVATTPDLITRVDGSGNFLYANHAMKTVFGFDPDSRIGHPAFEMIHPDDRESTQNAFVNWIKSDSDAVTFENRLLDASGQSHVMSWNIRLRRNEAGRVVDITSVARDVTERKRVEAKLQEHQTHLEELVQEQTQSLTLLLRKAEAANRAKSTFLANMSHELRTPLTSVIGFSRLMAEDSTLNEDQKRKLATINRSGNHLLSLINDVLELSKVEASGMVQDPQPTDPAELIEAAVEMMRPRAEQKGLTLLVRTSGLPPGIRADAAKLRQVLLNLLTNAIKFTEHGRIELTVTGSETITGWVRLEVAVADTGIGIAPEDLERVFEPFIQAGTGGNQVGTGLGLGISRQYVRMMGGDIHLDSQPGQGSRFTFTLVFETCASSKAPIAPTGKVIGLEANGPARRILVAEDNVDIRVLLSGFLAPLGFTIHLVADGAAALAAVQADPPDLVIMDWRMPEMDGVEATRRIRALEGIRQPRIIILTASAFEEERLTTLAAGADDFLRKPFEPDHLLSSLERQLDIRFHREDSKAPPPRTETTLTPTDLAALSETSRAALAEAVQELNLTKLAEVLAVVSREHPLVAAGIKDLIDGAKFRELWSMLEGNAR